MNQKHLQILMVLSLFVAVTALLVSPTFLGIFQTEETIGNSQVTIGDALTLFGLLGSTVTIGLWLTSVLKKRGKD